MQAIAWLPDASVEPKNRKAARAMALPQFYPELEFRGFC
jgi:hypothetical protein